MNNEGYKDPTADQAIARADRTPHYVRDVLHCLRTVAGLSGFRITNITIEDRRSGREYESKQNHTD